MSILNARIKAQRLSKGLTLYELATQLGIRDATLHRYESGKIKNVPYDMVTKLAEIFECSPSYLMGWADEVNAKEETPQIPAILNDAMVAFSGGAGEGLNSEDIRALVDMAELLRKKNRNATDEPNRP